MAHMSRMYKIHVDTGGTFTDCIALLPGGGKKYRKVLSNGRLRGNVVEWISDHQVVINESWEMQQDIIRGFRFVFSADPTREYTVKRYDPKKKILETDNPFSKKNREDHPAFEIWTGEEAPVLGIRLLTDTPPGEPFPPMEVRLGTTKGTNALLENRGAETILITTAGFRDILRIRNQQRSDIFARKIEKPVLLTDRVIEINERIGHSGEVSDPPDSAALEALIKEIGATDDTSVAVCFLNAYINPAHEEAVAGFLQKAGFRDISVSSEISGMIKFLDRTETTIVNAYLSPIIRNYLDEIGSQLDNENLRVMTSAGGLVKAGHYKPVDSLLSGPAGGVVGAAIKGRSVGESRLITFDMGGTSTDVSRYDGEYDYLYELTVGSAHIMSPALNIETVAAGGGSVCGYDGYKLFVGPTSAGAVPGPACYGAGGPLTITDINLLAGKLQADNFSIPIYPGAAKEALDDLAEEIGKATGKIPAMSELVESFIAIANEIMAGAIRRISILKGYDPSEYSMVSFGGAGGLHACGIASLLGMKKIILPEEAGLLSAFGIGQAHIERFVEKQVLKPLDEMNVLLEKQIESMRQEAIGLLVLEGVPAEEAEIRSTRIFLRYRGQNNSIAVDYDRDADLAGIFQDTYKKVYGHVTDLPIEVEAARVVASDKVKEPMSAGLPERLGTPEPIRRNENNMPVYLTGQLLPGHSVSGPAVLLDQFSTTFIENGWEFRMAEDRTGMLTQIETEKEVKRDGLYEADLELFTNRFMSIAENMGATLQRTAFSVNIKERLDFSCGLLDAEGNLVANAPHIPVHLGGLSVCVKTLLEKMTFKPGDTVVTNHPGFGGSHLPDVTTITPVFDGDQHLVGFVVNRAHHSEIGGISPGSMPPDATRLIGEGVVIKPFLLVENGKANWERMREILTSAPYPTRNPAENIADLNAALAANSRGAVALLGLVRSFGRAKVTDFFNALRRHAADRMKHTLNKIPDGEYTAEEFLDDGSPVVVKISKSGENTRIDFSGSADVHPRNMNATIAIVHSVVIYVLRLLLDEPIPLNDGLLEPVEIIVPTGMLNPEFPDDPAVCPAVVGGNVEISQRLTDTLLKAFGTMAASQGTMNNVLFGNDRFGYYETLAGGTGAGDGFPGADAVHHHMTNTRITDPEVIEHRYPVRIVETSIRKNSGGNGKWKGGDGMKRVYEFREGVDLSLLTQRRQSGPYGLAGGEAGQPGEQWLLKKDGTRQRLDGIVSLHIEPGEGLEILTPGGGGYGSAME